MEWPPLQPPPSPLLAPVPMEWPPLADVPTEGSSGTPGQRGTGPRRATGVSAAATPVTPAPPLRDVVAPAGGRSAGGRSAAALLSVGRRAQITKQLQFAAAAGGFVSQKGKGPKRMPVYRSTTPSPEPSVADSEQDDDVGEYDNVDGDEDEFDPLIRSVKELEDEEDDDDLYM